MASDLNYIATEIQPMKKILNIRFLIAMLVLPSISFAALDILDSISSALNTGNVTQLSSYFDSNVDITILDQESTYSKTQAVAVVQNFFSTNTVKGFQLLHRAGSGDGCYGIGNLQTSTQTLRTYFYVKTSGSISVIQELRFEKE